MALDALCQEVVTAFVNGRSWEKPVDELVARLDEAESVIDRFEGNLASLALSIGSTGLIPEHWNAEIVTAEQLAERHPTMDIPKGHAEGTFFATNGAYIGVHAEVAWYSTAKGVAEAEALAAK